MSYHVIPLDTTPNQEFHITLEVNGENVPFIMRLRFNTEGLFWKIDVADGRTGELKICGLPLVTGDYPAADLMRQFQYMGLGSAAVVPVTDKTAGNIPGIYDLGTDFVLIWGSGDLE